MLLYKTKNCITSMNLEKEILEHLTKASYKVSLWRLSAASSFLTPLWEHSSAQPFNIFLILRTSHAATLAPQKNVQENKGFRPPLPLQRAGKTFKPAWGGEEIQSWGSLGEDLPVTKQPRCHLPQRAKISHLAVKCTLKISTPGLEIKQVLKSCLNLCLSFPS